MKLICFLAACTVVWLGYVTKTVLRTYPNFTAVEQCLHSIEFFYFAHSAPSVSKAGAHKSLRMDTAKVTKSDIIQHHAQYDAQDVGTFVDTSFIFPSDCFTC